jgi:hypothetical protein
MLRQSSRTIPPGKRPCRARAASGREDTAMGARDATTLRIIVVKADASVMDALRLMLQNRIGGHPDHSEHGRSEPKRSGARKEGRRDPLSCQAPRSPRAGGVRSRLNPTQKGGSHEG